MTMLVLPPADLADHRTVQSVHSPEAVLAMEDDGLFELVDDQLIEKEMGYDANWIATQIAFFLKLHLRAHPLGDLLSEQTFACFPHKPRLVRRPDLSFIAAERVPSPRPEGHLTFPPDLAIEVVSPNDKVLQVETKLEDYRRAAIPLVWVIFPELRMVRVCTLGRPNVLLRDGDSLTGDPVLPGFAVAVEDLFPAMTPDETPST